MQKMNSARSSRMEMRRHLREDPSGYPMEDEIIARQHDEAMEMPTGPAVTSSPSAIPLSKLADQIGQYHKLVNELEVLVKKSTQTPEEQWRFRILQRSTEEADNYISAQIQLQCHQHTADPTLRASFGKSLRDYKRTHATFRKILMSYNNNVQGGETTKFSQNRKQNSFKRQISVEEDFFDKATRERELEVCRINSALQQAHELYKDLAHLGTSDNSQMDQVSSDLPLCETKQFVEANTTTARFVCGANKSIGVHDADKPGLLLRMKRRRKGASVCGDLDAISTTIEGDSTTSDTETDNSIASLSHQESIKKYRKVNKGRKEVSGNDKRTTRCNRKQWARREHDESSDEEDYPCSLSRESICNGIREVQNKLLDFAICDALDRTVHNVLTCGNLNDVEGKTHRKRRVA